MDLRIRTAALLMVPFCASIVFGQSAQTIRASVDSSGARANGSSLAPAISADGRFVAFWSYATNLVPGDTNVAGDVFVHDAWTGETTRVSVSSTGVQGNGWSGTPSISGDGRFVAFQSGATNLVAGGTNGSYYVYVHDRIAGTTTLASVSSSGAHPNAHCRAPKISADGRCVLFDSWASNLVSNDFNSHFDVFVRDLQAGLTTRASVRSNGSEVTEGGVGGAISGDGRYVAFESIDKTFVSGDTNESCDVFVHDRVSGETTRVSVNSAGNQAVEWSYRASISADGRFVAFESHAYNLGVYDSNMAWDVFVHDRATGQTRTASIEHDGIGDTANASSSWPSISPDGRFVAFESAATDLIADDTNGWIDVFVSDPLTGEVLRASVDSCGIQADGESTSAALGTFGRVAFKSGAINLVGDDTRPGLNVFVHQLDAGMPYCFGDGSGAPCACLNEGAPDAGCINSSGSGARLATAGSACLAEDELVFEAQSLPSNQPALLVCGLNALNGGSGIAFGDGLRCVGGALQRLATETGEPDGGAHFGPGIAGGWMPGDLRRFQVWYRDPAGPCGQGFNTTNALAVVFSP